MSQYLLNRNGTFYYNRRFPASFLRTHPALKPVFRISLGTGRKSEANKLSHRLSVMFDDDAKLYFSSAEIYAEAVKILAKYREAEKKSASWEEMENTCLIDFDEYHDHLLNKAIELEEKRNQKFEKFKESAIKNVSGDTKTTKPLLSLLVDKFIEFQRKSQNWHEASDSENKYRFSLKYFVELIDRPANLIDKSDIAKFKELLLKLPNCRQFPSYKEYSTLELFELPIPSDHVLSNNTIKQHSDRVSTFVKWLHDNDYIQNDLSNLFKNLVKKNKVKGKKAFGSQELNVLFSKDYKNLDQTKYWIPLLALHTGARLNEICQLDVDDIKKSNDIWIIDIMSEENEKSSAKRVKKESSRRIVPIHQKILDLGFIDYVKSRNGKRKLFDVSYTFHNGYGGKVGKWWSRYLKSCGLSGDYGFHSFRRTVITYFNQKLGINEIEHAYYTGHAPSGNEGVKTYTETKPLTDAKSMFDRLNFEINYNDLKKQ